MANIPLVQGEETPYADMAADQMPQQGTYAYPQAYPTYDQYNIQYAPMTVQQWGNIQSDRTDYSAYWSAPSAFEPEEISKPLTEGEEDKYNDLCCCITFYICLVATIGFFIYLSVALYTRISDGSAAATVLSNEEEINADNWRWTNLGARTIAIPVLIGVACAIVFNVLHFIFVVSTPRGYIKFSWIWTFLIITIAFVIPSVISGIWLIMTGLSFFVILALICCCVLRKHIDFSAELLRVALHVIHEIPGVFGAAILETFIEVFFVGISLFGMIAAIYLSLLEDFDLQPFAIFLSVWFAFFFLWSIQTYSYVFYMVTSGIMGTWYFLYGTEHMSNSPCWNSLKRAMTTSFGSAAKAGFIIAIIDFMEMFVEYGRSGGGCAMAGGGGGSDAGAYLLVLLIICILYCISICILKILHAIFGMINKFGLIYCAIFGVPYAEGARRFIEMKCKKFVHLLISDCIIGYAVGMNFIAFSLLSGAAAFGIGYLVDNENLYVIIFSMTAGLVACGVIFFIFRSPLTVYPDTLLICYCEQPERIKTLDMNCANVLEGQFNDSLSVRVEPEQVVQDEQQPSDHKL